MLFFFMKLINGHLFSLSLLLLLLKWKQDFFELWIFSTFDPGAPKPQSSLGGHDDPAGCQDTPWTCFRPLFWPCSISLDQIVYYLV